MLTFQDYLQIPDGDKECAEFVHKVIDQYKTSVVYKKAITAIDYDKCQNTTTMQYQKIVTDISGKQYVDMLATVHRSCSNFFNIFTNQLNQYLLGNGITWKNGSDFGLEFDTSTQEAGKAALVQGVSYGFWDLDTLKVFEAKEFAPLNDEETGGLAAGVRFWQVDSDKPLRATFYEMDGYTNYLWSSKYKPSDKWQQIDDGVYMVPKSTYKVTITESEADGIEIIEGENYPEFPIVPLWGNTNKQSEIVGLQEKIDAYDFILNGWEDDLDNAQLYWIISGAGGMDDPDLRRFLERLKTVGAAAPGDGQEVSPVTVSIPVEAREKLLDRLERQLYKDAMILNPETIASGAATATQIKAAYEPQNVKTDQFEYCVNKFLQGILKVMGVEDKPSFTRSTIVNTQEEIQTIVLAAEYLDREYITKKILTILGDGDQADEVLDRMDEQNMERITDEDTPPEPREGPGNASDTEEV